MVRAGHKTGLSYNYESPFNNRWLEGMFLFFKFSFGGHRADSRPDSGAIGILQNPNSLKSHSNDRIMIELLCLKLRKEYSGHFKNHLENKWSLPFTTLLLTRLRHQHMAAFHRQPNLYMHTRITAVYHVLYAV